MQHYTRKSKGVRGLCRKLLDSIANDRIKLITTQDSKTQLKRQGENAGGKEKEKGKAEKDNGDLII